MESKKRAAVRTRQGVLTPLSQIDGVAGPKKKNQYTDGVSKYLELTDACRTPRPTVPERGGSPTRVKRPPKRRRAKPQNAGLEIVFFNNFEVVLPLF